MCELFVFQPSQIPREVRKRTTNIGIVCNGIGIPYVKWIYGAAVTARLILKLFCVDDLLRCFGNLIIHLSEYP